MNSRVVSINVSRKKGTKKTPVEEAMVVAGYGVEGDAHASGTWHRQISLLSLESIEKMQSIGLKAGPGDFAENITAEGIVLVGLPVGSRLQIGEDIEVEITQIGKKCHSRCDIYKQAGDCIMPSEGIFVRVLKGGRLKTGDMIKIL